MSIGSLLRRVRSSGRVTPTSNVSSATVLAPGASTPRSLANVAATVAGVVSPRTYGAVLDGVTDDTAAVQAMLSVLGTTPRTIVVDGPCVVAQNITIPAVQPVRMEGNGAFVGSGIVTYAPWGVIGAGAPTVRRLPGTTLALDLSFGTYSPLAASTATEPSVTLDAARGAQKITWTAATAGKSAGLSASGSWDFSASDHFALDLGYDRAEVLTYAAIFMCFDAAGYTNYALRTVTPVSGIHPPRYTHVLPKADFIVTGAANWADVKRIEIRFYRESQSGVASLYAHGVWSHVRARPKVLLTFDDAVNSLYDIGFPIMRAAGMVGTAYANGATVTSGAGGTMTLAKLREMDAAGWDVACHTWSHQYMAKALTSYTRVGEVATIVFTLPHGYIVGNEIELAGFDQDEYNGVRTVASVPDANTITVATAGTDPDTTARGTGYVVGGVSPALIRAELRRNRDWLLSAGFRRAHRHHAFPYGAWSPEAVAIWRDEFAGETARQMGTNIIGRAVLGTVAGLGAPYHLPGYGLGNTTTAAAALVEVDRAISLHSSIVFLGHGMAASSPVSTQMLTAEFQALIDGLASRRDAGLLDVVTISEWFNRL